MAKKILSLRSIIIITIVIIISLFAWVFFPILVVVDRTSGIATVSVISARQRQSLTSLGGGTFVAIPKFEGAIEVRCSNGRAKVFGYVTRGTRSWVEITPDIAC